MSELLGIPLDRDFGRRIRWLIGVRWLVLTVVALLVLVANPFLGGVLPVLPIWGTILGIALSNGGFWLAAVRLSGAEHPPLTPQRFIAAQIATDLVALTVLLHFSGGIENPFSTYYIVLLALGSVLASRRSGYILAGLAVFLWIGLLLAEAFGVLPHVNLAGFRLPIRYRQPSHLIAESLVTVTAGLAVVYLTGSVTDRLHDRERLLAEANAAAEHRADELAALNERLRTMDEQRSLFMRLVTHELRAPVAAIQSYMQLILEGYVPEARLMEIVGKAESRARDQLDLIGDLLDLARLQDLPPAAGAAECDVVASLEDVLDLVQARLADRSLTVFRDLPDSPVRAPVSEDHMRQVWTNLVSNAIKYTPPGGQIHVRVAVDGSTIRAAVQDTGIGMSPEEMAHIFQTFYRAPAAKEMSQQGTGLGLTIVKGIVERYGGHVSVASEIGQGSTFSFDLPCCG
jgi:signal transduction histidine kinase